VSGYRYLFFKAGNIGTRIRKRLTLKIDHLQLIHVAADSVAMSAICHNPSLPVKIALSKSAEETFLLIKI
jgi:hypothetical protein